MKIFTSTLIVLSSLLAGTYPALAQDAAKPTDTASTAATPSSNGDVPLLGKLFQAADTTPVAPIPPRAVPATSGMSPHETVSAHIGSGRNAALVTITYGRPYSKKPGTTETRKIWGGLVPWGAVWRMGADEATTLITQVPLQFGDVTVPAGAYTLDMFPVENGPTKLIINKQIGQWGIPYTPAVQANELARVDMKKDTISSSVDQFTIAIENTAGATPPGGVIKAQWETTQYSVAFTIKQ